MAEQYTNSLANKIYNILVPLVGQLMAQSAVRLQAKKAGITPDTITKENLPFIAAEIEKALKIFVGSDKAHEVAVMINALSQS